MAVDKRGKVYWFKFVWDGETVRWRIPAELQKFIERGTAGGKTEGLK